MADFTRNIQDPNLSGMGQSRSVNTSAGSTRAGDAQAIGQLLQAAAGAYGQYKAKVLGTEIGGATESYEQAGQAADQASQELQGLAAEKSLSQGADVTVDQAKDLRNQVFNKVLTNQKRIQSAIDRGLISSTEGTARLNVLRNEALSNPLIAPYQDQLDNALYRTTGGSGTTFAATAEETAKAAASKGKLQAIEETEKQVTGMITTGIAHSRDQALNLIAQQAQIQRDLQGFSLKKAELGATSQEVYAANSKLTTLQASSAYGAIADWATRGGDAKEVQGIQRRLVLEAEQVKQGIRASAFDKNGQLLVDSDTLARQIADVDKQTQEFTSMLSDQTGTKFLTDAIAQRTAAQAYESQTIQLEIAKFAPTFYAMKDNPVASQWLWNNAVNQNELATAWQRSSNPLLRYMGELDESSRLNRVMEAANKFKDGAPIDALGGAALANTLPNKGGTAMVDRAYKADPERTLTNLASIPFNIKSLSDSAEWRKATSTPEGLVQVKAIIQGAANRALLSSVYEPETWSKAGGRMAMMEANSAIKFDVPAQVIVKQNEKPAFQGGRGGTAVGKKFEEWTIDTKGVRVSDQYKSEVVNAYKLGVESPQLWNQEYKSVDEWLNSLFARVPK